MAKKPLPCPTLLRLLLTYEPDTGKLYWRSRPLWMFEGDRAVRACKTWNKRYARKEALTARSGNYLVGSIRDTAVYAHRAATAIIHGSWPDEVDHINGDGADNRDFNIRPCNRSENTRNRRGITVYGKKPTTSRFGGVGRHQDGGWRARIVLRHPSGESQELHLGNFKTEIEAAQAYDVAAREHFGAFANLNFPDVIGQQ